MAMNTTKPLWICTSLIDMCEQPFLISGVPIRVCRTKIRKT